MGNHIDIINNTTDLYINGVCISTGYPTKYVMGTSICIRFIIEGATEYRAFIWNNINDIKPMYGFIPVTATN